MMHLFLRKRRCGRGNPRLGAALGLLSAIMIGFGAYLGQHHEMRTPLALAIGFAILAVGLVAIRFVAISQGDSK